MTTTANVSNYIDREGGCQSTGTVQVTSTLWWSNSNNPFDWQRQRTANGGPDLGSAQATAEHWCTVGTSHYWHTENQSTVLDNTTGTEYEDTANSNNAFFKCS